MTSQQYIPLIAVAIALFVVILRNRTPRKLRPERLWVAPVIVVLLIALAIWSAGQVPGASHAAFSMTDWMIIGIGLILGSIAGWWRGKMTRIERHVDGSLSAQASPIGMILIVGLLLGRRALSALLEPHAAALGVNATAVADSMLIFVVGMIIVQRVEMYIRASRVAAGGSDSHVEDKA